ncbi:MAG: potassium/proton antiporter [Ignavibacteriales bacterium]|nr:potassium/proton antiporter [Ignavibacteriales bacterium]
MVGIDFLLLIGALLILASIAIAKASDNLGVPTLVLFIAVGMLAGSEGPGGIFFDDAGMAQSIGIVALIFILFAGGLDTRWTSVRPVLWQALSLSTLGVFVTALSVGLFVHYVLEFSLLSGLLLGAIISSTDAAAVFSVLRSKNVSLRGKLKPLLELESGSNDPMAVFLTVGTIQLITSPESTLGEIILLFVVQMGLGVGIGLALGKGMVLLINRMKFSYEGMYPVFSLAAACFIYALTAVIGGSGFMAVYVGGLVVGNSEIVQKKSLFRFFDGLAWLGQIGMFLTLGLLVYPSNIAHVVGGGLLVSAFLMFVARPFSVFFATLLTDLQWREKTLVSWVGLRGAVPIILATFPKLARVPDADVIFNLVFFIVLTSALFQGWSLPAAARLLKVDAPMVRRRRYPLEFEPTEGVDAELQEFIVPYNSSAIGRPIVELGMPPNSLIVLISRNERMMVPSGGTILEPGDTILALVSRENLAEVRAILAEQKEKAAEQ